jgi:hypothetical protein
VLLRRLFVEIVWNVQFHVFVKAAEAIAERGIFDSLFICDDKVVQGFQTGDGINDEVPVARDGADGIRVECYV